MAGKNREEILDGFEKLESKSSTVPTKLTVLPLRDIIIFPNMIFPILIGRSSTLKAVAEAVERDKYIFVTAQKSSATEEPQHKDIYKYGTIAKIIQVLRLPNNLLKVLVEGLFQAKIKKQVKNEDFLEAEVTQMRVTYNAKDKELQALIRKTSSLFAQYIKKDSNLPPDIVTAYDNLEDPVQKLYFCAANIKSSAESKQPILESRKLKEQYYHVFTLLNSEIEMLKLEDEIDTKITDTIQKTQRKYYIQEQIRALQTELGDEIEISPELQSLKEQIEKAKLPEHAMNKAMEELERLSKTPSMSPEFSVNRNYVELLAQVPWHAKSDDTFDINRVKKILDEDHYDLEKPKERILEFIAILNLAGSLKRQILCFVGPPGVGKTSLAKSIARALDRQFVRFSLGGVRDEAEIRGHRRTYIGAMPGKIIQSMKKAGTINPVILMDEIDKMAMDFRGDPSSALLEVLDPEQNINFNDHYLEVDYDLSSVLFITTANVRHEIPLPLQDRMEIIELSSYLDPEKLQIAKRHIIPNLKKEYGIDDLNITVTDEALLKVINQYTREAGVRNLEREIASIFRKLAKEMVQDYHSKSKQKLDPKKSLRDNPNFKRSMKNRKIVIDPDKVEDYLKAPKFKDRLEELKDKVGVATGLAWTSTGGALLPIEVTIMPAGSDKLTLTGKLGDVMKESAQAALSYIRSNWQSLGVDEKFSEKKEIHIHVPEGAIPKDGPSAGITMAIALISAASGKEVRGDLAMTGEITLRGNILPIGGLKEKLLSAKRHKIKTVLVPEDNARDIEDIDVEITRDLEIIPIKHIDEALEIAFRNWK